MAFRRTAPAGLIAHGYWSTTLTNSTAYGVNSTCSTATACLFSVETQAARVRWDLTDPTATTGILYGTANGPYFLEGINMAAIKFQAAVANAKISLFAFRRPGEEG